MKLKNIICLFICVITVLALVSCGPKEDPNAVKVPSELKCTVTVKVDAMKGEAEKILIDAVQITLRDKTEWPTILEALSQACFAYDITYASTADASTVDKIGKYTNFANGCFWEWTRNGEAPEAGEGKAGSALVQDGDIYVFTYTTVE